jgi:hypothetical protein
MTAKNLKTMIIILTPMNKKIDPNANARKHVKRSAE